MLCPQDVCSWNLLAIYQSRISKNKPHMMSKQAIVRFQWNNNAFHRSAKIIHIKLVIVAYVIFDQGINIYWWSFLVKETDLINKLLISLIIFLCSACGELTKSAVTSL